MQTQLPRHEESLVPRIQLIGVTGIAEVKAGDQLGDIIVAAATKQGTPVEPGDVIVVTQKVVSKAEGRVVDLREVEPSALASRLAKLGGKDARQVELVLRESRAIIRMDVERGIIISETSHGLICANAGVDFSNVPGDSFVSLLPVDPDASARQIREQLCRALSEGTVAVIITDTFGRPWREGHVNFAVGAAGISPLRDYRGTPDVHGKVLKVTNVAIADELACAAELVTAKTAQVPVVIVRGYHYAHGPDTVESLKRPRSLDLFR